MNENLSMWLFGGIAAWLISLSGCVIKIMLSQARIETTFEIIGQKAARALHRDDNLHRLDELLDKYLDRNYELSFEEWQSLLNLCEIYEASPQASDAHKMFAFGLSAVCHHKLRHSPDMIKRRL